MCTQVVFPAPAERSGVLRVSLVPFNDGYVADQVSWISSAVLPEHAS